MGTTDRTTIRLSDERKQLLEQAERIVAASPNDDPPMSDVIDAALTHLIESHDNMDDLRGDVPQTTIQQFNTSVIGLYYRTDIESRWR
jgi:hypothetical protein